MKRTLLGTLTLLAACSTEPRPYTRIVTFGDSNTEYAWDAKCNVVAVGYIDPNDTSRYSAPNHPQSLAGMIERLAPGDKAASGPQHRGVLAVNHALGGTTTDDARYRVVNGVSRFEAEVLGMGYPWNGGEKPPIVRERAFIPDADDFAYISMGSNDGNTLLTVRNTRWMVEQWLSSGRQANHLILTTLGPAQYGATGIPRVNDSIRVIAKQTGVQLIDLADYLTYDNGLTWRSETLQCDAVHYAEPVRLWLATQIVGAMNKARSVR